MRKPFILTVALLLLMGALPALAGWDEGVTAFTEKRKPRFRGC